MLYNGHRDSRKAPKDRDENDSEVNTAGRKFYRFNFYSGSKTVQAVNGAGADNANIKDLLATINQQNAELMEYKKRQLELENDKKIEDKVNKMIAGMGLIAEEKEPQSPIDRIAALIEKSPKLMGRLEDIAISFADKLTGQTSTPRTTMLADNTGAGTLQDMSIDEQKKIGAEQFEKARYAVIEIMQIDYKIGDHLQQIARLAKEKPAMYEMAVKSLYSIWPTAKNY